LDIASGFFKVRVLAELLRNILLDLLYGLALLLEGVAAVSSIVELFVEVPLCYPIIR